MGKPEFLHYFSQDIQGIPVPEKFTFPFCYEPHALSIIASDELQHYLQHQSEWQHNFGLGNSSGQQVIGKMFGVLVVTDSSGTPGYLCAFSGKLAGTNAHKHFVPPVFDMLQKDSFFLLEEEEINEINRQIATLEQDELLTQLKTDLQAVTRSAEESISHFRQQLKKLKEERKQIRTIQTEILSASDFQLLEADLIKQSLRDKHELSVLQKDWKSGITEIQEQLDNYHGRISLLKEERKAKSGLLQTRLFEQYLFLNKKGISKDIRSIFEQFNQSVPPAGAGECAAPKLLQYAFLHQLTPVAMAEFWWGDSPASEIRKHKNYYPACKGKCEPILSHMLDGMILEDNPLLEAPKAQSDLEILYDDEDIAVVNKPAEFLSVPGIHIQDSVYTRMQTAFPEATGPIIVHRLDMSTSGILLIAKHKDAHKFIQQQFINHSIEKRYVALLDGIVAEDEGIIDLPLRLDLDDRPRQMVCYEYGKKAITKFQVLSRVNGKTKILFFPVTGRTHQLRVHAAHLLGLHTPIVGDDLYGTKSNRLHLHAAYLSFVHPRTKKTVIFEVKAPF
ncbi:pseudouridine synthase [Sphingobacterium spiritivorum]|uniref:RluA family pseudouridine synthase n=1 Tax=Sphingobacterium spiritivorum TaxID=258 RepID=UPI003DA4F039